MRITYNFPVSDYFKDHILAARTLTRGGNWLSAVLVLEDPKTKRPFVVCYQWENKDGVWKKRQSFSWKALKSLDEFLEVSKEFRALLMNDKPENKPR